MTGLEVDTLQEVDTMKKGGRVVKRKNKKSTAIANATVNVYMAKRGGNKYTQPRPRPLNQLMNASGGNFALENQLMKFFQNIQHPPLQSTIVQKAQGHALEPVDVELPEQRRNIINLQDLAENETIRQLHEDQFRRAEWNRQEQFSSASHLPSSVDSGDPAEVRSIPFTHLSYGDENSVQRRYVNELPDFSDTSSILPSEAYLERRLGYYEAPLDFDVNHPAEPELSDEKEERVIVPRVLPTQPVNNFGGLSAFRYPIRPIGGLLNPNRPIRIPQLEDENGQQLIALPQHPPYALPAGGQQDIQFIPAYQRMTPLPTKKQIKQYGSSPTGYYTIANNPRFKGRRNDEISYISERSGLPKLAYEEPRGAYGKRPVPPPNAPKVKSGK